MNNKIPDLSIIVPVYNVEKFLRQCLDSIIAQTYIDWECILIDDGSTDGSEMICDEYAKIDTRFVVIHQQNEGVAKARLTAFKKTIGEFVTFIDADDYVDEEYLEHLYKNITYYSADMVCSQYFECELGKVKPNLRKIIGLLEDEKLKKALGANALFDVNSRQSEISSYLWAKMFRRIAIQNALPFGHGLWMGEDHVSVLYALLHVKTVFISTECHYYYVFHQGQATARRGIDRIKADILLWQRIEEIDTDRIFKNQMGNKIYFYLKYTLLSEVKKSICYRDFRCFFDTVFSYGVVKRYLKHAECGSFSWKDKILFILIKRKLSAIVWVYKYL